MDRGHQLIRQWKLLQILEGYRRGATVAMLHRRIDEDCVQRTLRRDLETLRTAGFPIILKNGRWRLLKTGEGAWAIPVQPSMIVALMVSEEMLENSPLAQPLRDLRDRVQALLSPTARSWCDALRQRFGVSAPPQVHVPGDVEDAVDKAIADQLRLRIDYWSPSSGDTTRTIDPVILYHVHGGLYVFGWDDRSGQRRMFAMQRISRATITDQRFTPDPDFDPVAYLRDAFGATAGPKYRMVVDFAPAVAHLLRERDWHPSQQLEERDGGWVRASWTMSGLPEVARWLAGFGGDARVVSPIDLKRAVSQIHRAGLDSPGRSLR